MQKISRQNSPNAFGVGHADPLLPTPEEIRLGRTQLLTAELAPLSTKQVMDLIGATRANDQLRLNVPESRSSPKQDFFVLHNLMARTASSDVSSKLIALLQEPQIDLAPESANFMRASLAREHNMLELVKEMMDSMSHIHNRIIGSQEG
jgi:hypothetical protein